MTAQGRGRLDEADDWYRKALTISEELGDRPRHGDHLPPARHHRPGPRAAGRGRRLVPQSPHHLRGTRRPAPHGGTYHQLGITAQDRGRLDEADDWYRKALTINEELGDRPGMASTYHQLGMTAQDRGRLDEADDWYRKSLTINEELGDRPGMALTYAQLGLLAEERGQPRWPWSGTSGA